MLTMGMTGRVVTDWVGDGRITRYGVRFAKQVWPGDTLTATVTVTAINGDIADFDVVTVNQHGDEVVRGYAAAKIDV